MPQSFMPQNDSSDAIRQEIIHLLHAQLEALADLSGLTDLGLAACYQRHERVRELRDRLAFEANTGSGQELSQSSNPISAGVISVEAPQAAGV
jgi:hypothetical protein